MLLLDTLRDLIYVFATQTGNEPPECTHLMSRYLLLILLVHLL